jgi:hypothetical protein
MTKELQNSTAATMTISNQPKVDPEVLRDSVREGFKSHTEGEKKFNNLTYKWVGYFGVTGFSVFLTWLIKDSPFKLFGGKRLAEHFDTLVKWSAKTIDSKNPTNNEKTFRSFWTIGTLFIGGSVVSVLPVKWLEDSKVRLVKKFDREIYGEEAVANDPTIVNAHRLIESQPKQGWPSVIGSRITAFIATFVTWITLGDNASFLPKKLGTSIDTIGVQIGRWSDRIRSFNNPSRIEKIHAAVAENIADMKLHGELRDLNKHDSIFSRVFSYIGMDSIYTVITSIGLFVSTRFLGPLLYKNEKTTDAAVNSAQNLPLNQDRIKEKEMKQSTKTPTPQTTVREVAHASRLEPSAAQAAVHV